MSQVDRDAWQSMDTAPRDGTTFLAYNSFVGVYQTAYTVRWTGEPGEYEAWRAGAPSYEGFPCGFISNSVGGYPFGKWDCTPTAWRPMPVGPPPELCHRPDRDALTDLAPAEPEPTPGFVPIVGTVEDETVRWRADLGMVGLVSGETA